MKVETPEDARCYLKSLPDSFKHRIQFHARYRKLVDDLASFTLYRQRLRRNQVVIIPMRDVEGWPSYQAIIGLGNTAIPFLLEEALKDEQTALLLRRWWRSRTCHRTCCLSLCWRGFAASRWIMELTPSVWNSGVG